MKITKVDVYMLDAGVQRASRRPIIARVSTDENAVMPSKAHDDDFCYDCYAVSEEEVAPNVWKYGLGFALQIENRNKEPSTFTFP